SISRRNGYGSTITSAPTQLLAGYRQGDYYKQHDSLQMTAAVNGGITVWDLSTEGLELKHQISLNIINK
ncbi:MAG: hypothetical protein AAGI11_09750, partial [Pseudomonadota bacterium]